MFGCGLPVFTAAYPCISELVQDGVNGLHFLTSTELGQQLVDVFTDFPDHSKRLAELKRAVISSGRASWESEWERVVLPIFRSKNIKTK